ncbi:hypothetical protein T492DRAFT_1016174 [Pavlovales sp. CCMP2436]|nr:hypothetical protein T492DRAFT_1016174 [Pavlovales sp. CCMP2436]
MKDGDALSRSWVFVVVVMLPSVLAAPPTDAVVYASRATGGRMGHQLFSALTANVLGGLYGWRVYEPCSFDVKDNRIRLSGLIDLSRLGVVNPLGKKRCPADRKRVLLDGRTAPWPRYEGVETRAQLDGHVLAQIGSATGPLCVELYADYRVLPHTLYAWEMARWAPPGSYDALCARARSTLTLPSPEYPAEAVRTLIVAVHLRRGDRVYRQFRRTNTYYAVAAAIRDAVPNAHVHIMLITEALLSTDIISTGCASLLALSAVARRGEAAGVTTGCTARNGTVGADLSALVHADVLVVAPSSFSMMAAAVRNKGLVVMPHGMDRVYAPECPPRPMPEGKLDIMPPRWVCPYTFGHPGLNNTRNTHRWERSINTGILRDALSRTLGTRSGARR